MPHICFYFNFLRQHELALNYINDKVASFFQVFHEFRVEIRFLSCKICSKSLINSRKLYKDRFIGLFEIINSNCQSPIFDLIFGISENWTSFCKMNNSACSRSFRCKQGWIFVGKRALSYIWGKYWPASFKNQLNALPFF